MHSLKIFREFCAVAISSSRDTKLCNSIKIKTEWIQFRGGNRLSTCEISTSIKSRKTKINEKCFYLCLIYRVLCSLLFFRFRFSITSLFITHLFQSRVRGIENWTWCFSESESFFLRCVLQLDSYVLFFSGRTKAQKFETCTHVNVQLQTGVFRLFKFNSKLSCGDMISFFPWTNVSHSLSSLCIRLWFPASHSESCVWCMRIDISIIFNKNIFPLFRVRLPLCGRHFAFVFQSSERVPLAVCACEFLVCIRSVWCLALDFQPWLYLFVVWIRHHFGSSQMSGYFVVHRFTFLSHHLIISCSFIFAISLVFTPLASSTSSRPHSPTYLVVSVIVNFHFSFFWCITLGVDKMA